MRNGFFDVTLQVINNRKDNISTNPQKTITIMKKYVCDVCGWEYDPEVGVPEEGIEPGTPFPL